MEYEFHSIVKDFPPMQDWEFEQLKENIAEVGLLVPIVVWQEQIVDGRHRYWACMDTGVEPKYRHLDGDYAGMINYVQAYNVEHRNITLDQKKAAILKLNDRRGNGGDREIQEEHTMAELAEMAGSSRSSMFDLAAVQDADPELFEEVAQGKVSANSAKALLEYPPKVRKETLERFSEGGYKSPQHAAREVTREINRENLMARAEKTPANDRYKLHSLPIAMLHEKVEAGSIDLIITDPPYPKEYIHLFKDLAAFAAHALKPGGGLVVMAGNFFLDEKIMNLSHPELKFRTSIAYHMPGKHDIDRGEIVQVITKPVLVYHKIGGKLTTMIASYLTYEETQRDDSLHHWGQQLPGFEKLVEMFTKEQKPYVICDPFMGGGTTGVAAIKAGFDFVGNDINEDEIRVVKGRLLDYV